MFNIAAAEGVFLLLLIGVLWRTWPNPPWELLTWGSALLMLALPVLAYPFSKTLFLGFDLLFRPASSEELAGRKEEAGTTTSCRRS